MHLSTPLPGLVGHPAPPLRPQSCRASTQEFTGTENTRRGAQSLHHPAPTPRQGIMHSSTRPGWGSMVHCAGSQKTFVCGNWILADFCNRGLGHPYRSANPVCKIRIWNELYQALFEARAGAACAWRNQAENTRLFLLTSLLGLQPLVPHHHPTSKYADFQYMSPAAQRYPGHAPRFR